MKKHIWKREKCAKLTFVQALTQISSLVLIKTCTYDFFTRFANYESNSSVIVLRRTLIFSRPHSRKFTVSFFFNFSSRPRWPSLFLQNFQIGVNGVRDVRFFAVDLFVKTFLVLNRGELLHIHLD